MELIRSIHNLRQKHSGCVATIGKFDGVHLGHKQILAQLRAKATELNLPSLVILFEPHPAEFFVADKAPVRLTSLAAKLTYLAEQGVDRVLCLSFNAKLSAMTAQEFVQDLLVEKLAIAHFVVGDDFRFGRARSGNFQMLQIEGERHGFSVESTITHTLNNERVSSTKVRDVLAEHNFEYAAQLLGRAYCIKGRVMHGQKLARTFGVPTANIKIGRFNPPLRGVFAVTGTLRNGEVVQGVANIGKRPTVDGIKPILEVHLFDFKGDLYGQKLSVEFKQFIRAEQKFADLDQLKQAILNDVEVAKQYFATCNQ